MASYSWIGGSGDWNVPGNWTPSGPPKATDSATIAATGSDYTVTVDTTDAAGSLALSSADATLEDTASLTIGGTLTISAGSLNVISSGVLTANGPLNLSGGKLVISSSSGTAASLAQTGGTLGGTGKLTVSGAATFSGSQYSEQSGTGTTLLDGVTSDSGYIALDGGRVLENAGAFNVTGELLSRLQSVHWIGRRQHDQERHGRDVRLPGRVNALQGIRHERVCERGHAGGDPRHRDGQHWRRGHQYRHGLGEDGDAGVERGRLVHRGRVHGGDRGDA